MCFTIVYNYIYDKIYFVQKLNLNKLLYLNLNISHRYFVLYGLRIAYIV